MARASKFVASLVLAAGLGACGDHLGTYKVEDVQVVRQMPSNDADESPDPPYPEYLRIELSSEFNLNAADTGPGLYTDADFCPIHDPHRLIAFGPLASDELTVESWKRHARLVPSRQDGRYHYFVYVVPSFPPRKLFANSTNQIPAYDLRQGRRAICLRFFVPGYNIIKSRSDTVEVPAQLLAQALRSQREIGTPQSSSS